MICGRAQRCDDFVVRRFIGVFMGGRSSQNACPACGVSGARVETAENADAREREGGSEVSKRKVKEEEVL